MSWISIDDGIAVTTVGIRRSIGRILQLFIPGTDESEVTTQGFD